MQGTLICWHCGARKTVHVPYMPTLAVEFAALACENGLYCAIDTKHNRILIFCSKEHAEAEKTKKGEFFSRSHNKKKT